MKKTLKGQFLRLFFGGKVVAGATNATVHVSATLEDASTKDVTNGWQEQEITGLAFDVTSEALIYEGDDAEGVNPIELLKAMIAGNKVAFELSMTNGDQNRVKVSDTTKAHTLSGNVIINDASIGAQNRQNSTATFQAQGYGPLLVDGKEVTESDLKDLDSLTASSSSGTGSE